MQNIRDKVWKEMEPLVDEMIRSGKTKEEILRMLESQEKIKSNNARNKNSGLKGPEVWLKETLKSIPK